MYNQKFYVLSPELEICPLWVAGHLYIGGIGVAEGYWKDPIKTNAQFITHPQTGERLYNTGDLGRLHPDGLIEFIGREDNQVKVRGFRVDLGEIEHMLKHCPGVREAIVVASGTITNRQLISFFIKETRKEDEENEYKKKQTQASAAALKLNEPAIRRFNGEHSVTPFPTTLQSQAFINRYIQRQSHRNFSPFAISDQQLKAFVEPCTKLVNSRGFVSWPPRDIEMYIHVNYGRVAGMHGGVS